MSENKRIKSTASYISKNENENLYSFVLTEEIVDRDNEVVLIKGLDTTNYKSNPQVFYNHESQKFPVGLIKNLYIKDNKLIGDVWFNEVTDESKLVKELIDVGQLKTGSIGFLVKAGEYKKDNVAYIITESELLEFSIVPLPANINAVRVKELKRKQQLNIKLNKLKRNFVMLKKKQQKASVDDIVSALNEILDAINSILEGTDILDAVSLAITDAITMVEEDDYSAAIDSVNSGIDVLNNYEGEVEGLETIIEAMLSIISMIENIEEEEEDEEEDEEEEVEEIKKRIRLAKLRHITNSKKQFSRNKKTDLQVDVKSLTNTIQNLVSKNVKVELAKNKAPSFIQSGYKADEDPLFWGKFVWLGAKALHERTTVKNILNSGKFNSQFHRIKDGILASVGSDGGNVLMQEYEPGVLPILTPKSVVREAGAGVIKSSSGVHKFRKTSSMPEAVWVGEVDALDKTAPKYETVTASVKKLAAFVPVSNTWLKLAEPSIFNDLQQALFTQMANKEDATFINGTGTEHAPKGIINRMDAGHKKQRTATPTAITKRKDLTTLVSLVESSDINIVNGGWIMPPSTFWALCGTGSALQGDDVEFFRNIENTRKIYGYPIYTTNNCPAGEIYFGDFDKLKIVQSSQIEIATSAEVYFNTDETAIRLISLVDLVMLYDKAFAQLYDATDW